MTMLDNDLDIIAYLDWDPTLKCDGGGVPSGCPDNADAAWIVVYGCCGLQRPLCDKCMRIIYAKWEAPYVSIHRICGHSIPSLTITPVHDRGGGDGHDG